MHKTSPPSISHYRRKSQPCCLTCADQGLHRIAGTIRWLRLELLENPIEPEFSEMHCVAQAEEVLARIGLVDAAIGEMLQVQGNLMPS